MPRPAPCDDRGMRLECKQRVNGIRSITRVVFAISAAVAAQASVAAAQPDASEKTGDAVAGGVALGESFGGVTDRAHVLAPADYRYVAEREPGSFLDCGAGAEARATDASGRDVAALACGVTLTETVVIPAASASARLIIHF